MKKCDESEGGVSYWLLVDWGNGDWGWKVGKLGARTDYTDYADFFMLMIGGFRDCVKR